MNNLLYKISLSFGLILSITLGSQLNAQDASGIQKKLLVRDSLDFKQANSGFNTKAKEFNPIPFKDGLLFISNKQTAVNKLGFNKVYWVPKSLIGKKDSLTSAINLNDEFTAPTSNDNNILYRYNKKKVRMANNAIENKFAEFVPEESFAIDDTAAYIVYPQLSNRKIAGEYKWELWEANLVDGKLKNAHKIIIKDSAADYINPFLSADKTKLYFSSNRAGGKGGFDIYVLDKVNGVWSVNPVTNACVNTVSDEINPTVNGFDLLFSSNRAGGMGGFDVYRVSIQPSITSCDVNNLGYPVNTAADDSRIIQLNSDFYVSSKQLGAMDIAAIQYKPVSIPLSGQLAYLNDSTLSPNQALYVYDNDTQKVVDTIYTDANAKYNYAAKPNRNYRIQTKNADGIEEFFALTTNDKITSPILFATNLKGRSPRQIKDSTEKVWAAIEQKRQDSIAAVSLESKFIVYYGFDKSVLTAKEKLVLDSLYNKLQKMPSTYLIVGAFTDCVGSFKYNYTLSVNRAKYVVNYLKKKGLPSSRFVSNGYSKNYTITPCTVSLNKKAQQNNRRAEIVLSDVGNTNWAKLEKERGKSYYAVYDSKKNIIPTKTILSKAVVSNVVEKSTDLASASVGTSLKKKKLNAVNTKGGPSLNAPILAAQEKKVVTIEEKIPAEVKTKVSNPVVIKPVIAKTTLVKTVVTKPVDTIASSKSIVKSEVKSEVKLVAAPSTYVDDEISKAEILKALDSLAKLRIEQDRIVEYLTKRINKKPIDIMVSSDSVTIEIYDNAVHDKDSVSIIFNNRIIVDKQELKVNKPIQFKLKVNKDKKYNEMIMVAENLGAEPPNTAVMFVTEKNGRRQQIMLSTDMLHNEVVYFIRIGKE
ncbi:MAG: OmpA family protein [Sediminibacterium sp.]|nr:OmpA family protein [Sediminibacterium sp.]